MVAVEKVDISQTDELCIAYGAQHCSAQHLAPAKARLTFVPEGRSPLGTVLRTRRQSLIAGFHVEDVLKRHGETLIEAGFGQSIRQGGSLG